MKQLLLIIALLTGVFALPSPLFAQSAKSDSSTVAEAKILKVESVQTSSDSASSFKKVTLFGITGPIKNKTITVQDQILQTTYKIAYKPGDTVMVSYGKDMQGKESIYIVDYTRKGGLFLLFVLFVLLVIIVGRFQGFMSLLALAFSFFIIGSFIVPGILQGNQPHVISLLGALLIIPVTFYLGHGFNKKTTVAIVSTFITLFLVAVLSGIFVELTKLTGYASEEAVYLQTANGSGVNVQSLLLAGIIIGAMAVLNDITISQSSIVRELITANPKLNFRELYTRAMAVGRDHVASLVDTMVLVYAGASLPLFLLFYQNTSLDLGVVMNQEVIATEIVRTMVSSIGIIAAVPITTALAVFVMKK